MRLHALAVVHDLSAFYPIVRPVEDEVLGAFADAAVARFDEVPASLPPALVEEGLALLDARERPRLLGAAATMRRYRWGALVRSIGDAEIARRALAASAVRGAIADRLLPPRRALEFLERVRAIESGGNALLFVLPAAGVWSIDDLADLNRVLSDLEHMSREWIDSANSFAEQRLGGLHVRRVRLLAGHFAERLPLKGLRRVSSLLEEGCSLVALDDEVAYEIAVKLLGKYVVHARADARAYAGHA